VIFSNTYSGKVRATLTTDKGLVNPESIETADKIITVTVEGLRITTADVSVPENKPDTLVKLTTNTNFGVSFFVTGGADKNKFSISSERLQ
jgi:hypothetical protein